MMKPYTEQFFIAHYCASLFLTSATCLALGVFVLAKNARSTVNRMFALFMVSVGTWSITQGLIGTWPDPSVWLLIARIEHYGHVFIPSLFLHFVHAFIGLRQPRRLRWSYALSLVFFCLVPTRLFIREMDLYAFAKFALHGGVLYPPYMLWFIATVVEALVKLHRAIAASAEQPLLKRKLQYMFWATLIGYTGGLPNFLYVYGIDAYPLVPFCTYLVPIYPTIIAYAIVRHQVLDLRIVIRKSLVYSVLVAVITAVYFCVVLLAEKGFQDLVGYRSLVASVVAGFVIALGVTPLKDGIQRLVDWCFFRAPHEQVVRRMERLEREVRETDKLKAISTLAAGLAHEIKNPLTSIKTFAAYLPEKGSDPAFQHTFRRIVTKEVDKIDRVVRQLLDFAKPAPLHLQPVQVSRLLEETLELLNSECLERRVEVMRAYTPEDALHADPQQLRQVFLNLLLNSLEAMNGHGGRLVVSTTRQSDRFSVTIRDSGCGIPKEHLTRLGDPFFTTKAGGTGLGLSVVSGIIKDHHGTMRFESLPQRGTTVTLAFPVS